jgi:hypothetical protein
MDFKGYFAQGIRLVKLDKDAAAEVAADPESFGPAVLFIAIGGLAGGIGHTVGSMGIGSFMLIVGPIAHVIASFISVGILYLVAKIFGGTGTYRGYYSALGIGSLPHWAQVVPVLGWIAALWYIPVMVIVTERVHNLSTGKAIAVVLIPFIITFLLVLIAIAFVGMAAFMGMMHMDQMGM